MTTPALEVTAIPVVGRRRDELTFHSASPQTEENNSDPETHRGCQRAQAGRAKEIDRVRFPARLASAIAY
jgi:hypothetical protein